MSIEYEIASSTWSALTRVSPSNVELYRANLLLLDPGVVATDVTATVTAGAASVVSGVALNHNQRGILWYIEAGEDEESFTLRLTVTTNDGQTLVFPVDYVVG